jgi:hypothetical protein
VSNLLFFLLFLTNVVDNKSVYVKNVSRYFTEVDLEIEFNKFGRLVPDGVAIRSHKVFYMDIEKFVFISLTLFGLTCSSANSLMCLANGGSCGEA